MGSGAAFGKLVANHARDQIPAWNEAKNRIIEVNRNPCVSPSRVVMSIFNRARLLPVSFNGSVARAAAPGTRICRAQVLPSEVLFTASRT